MVRRRLAAAGVLLLALLALGVGNGLVWVASRLLERAGVSLSVTGAVLLSLALVQGLTFGGVAVGYHRYRGHSVRDLFAAPSVRDSLSALAAYGLSLAGAVVGAVVVTLLGLSASRNRVAEVGVGSPELFLVLVPAAFLLIGPGEELLFRGVVQKRLRESFGPVVSVSVAAVFFAGVHVVALSGALDARVVSVAVLVIPSLVFGAVYEVTDNLVVPVVVHGAYDATLFVLLYLVLKLAELGLAPAPA